MKPGLEAFLAEIYNLARLNGLSSEEARRVTTEVGCAAARHTHGKFGKAELSDALREAEFRIQETIERWAIGSNDAWYQYTDAQQDIITRVVNKAFKTITPPLRCCDLSGAMHMVVCKNGPQDLIELKKVPPARIYRLRGRIAFEIRRNQNKEKAGRSYGDPCSPPLLTGETDTPAKEAARPGPPWLRFIC